MKKEVPPTKITIGKKSEQIITSDGQQFTVKELSMHRNAKNPVIDLRSLTNHSNINEVELLLEKGWRKRKLQVPKNVTHGIAEYLKLLSIGERNDKDCYSFACIVSNIPLHKVSDIHNYWETKPLDKVEVGDIVIIISSDKENDKYTNFHHAAVYVGHNLYISVYGLGGDVEVSSLDDMLVEFKGETALLLQKKKGNS